MVKTNIIKERGINIEKIEEDKIYLFIIEVKNENLETNIYKRPKKDKSQLTLREEEEKYILEYEPKKVHQVHDKILKTVFDYKKEVAELINIAFPKQEEITKENIEKYNSSYINKMFKSKEADVVYKLKNRNVFILVELQRKNDFAMSKRILDYQKAIIEEVEKNSKEKNVKNKKYATVLTIVLFTGEEKWKATKYIGENQEQIKGIEAQRLGEYKLIDINNYTKEELLEGKSILKKILLLEKSKTNEELYENLEEIVKGITTEEDKELIYAIIKSIFSERLNHKQVEELLGKLEEGESEEKSMVMELVERNNREFLEKGKEIGKEIGKAEGKAEGKKEGVKQGIRQGIKQGIKESKISMILEMYREGINEKLIKKITKANQKELEEIKEKYNTESYG